MRDQKYDTLLDSDKKILEKYKLKSVTRNADLARLFCNYMQTEWLFRAACLSYTFVGNWINLSNSDISGDYDYDYSRSCNMLSEYSYNITLPVYFIGLFFYFNANRYFDNGYSGYLCLNKYRHYSMNTRRLLRTLFYSEENNSGLNGMSAIMTLNVILSAVMSFLSQYMGSLYADANDTGYNARCNLELLITKSFYTGFSSDYNLTIPLLSAFIFLCHIITAVCYAGFELSRRSSNYLSLKHDLLNIFVGLNLQHNRIINRELKLLNLVGESLCPLWKKYHGSLPNGTHLNKMISQCDAYLAPDGVFYHKINFLAWIRYCDSETIQQEMSDSELSLSKYDKHLASPIANIKIMLSEYDIETLTQSTNSYGSTKQVLVPINENPEEDLPSDFCNGFVKVEKVDEKVRAVMLNGDTYVENESVITHAQNQLNKLKRSSTVYSLSHSSYRSVMNDKQIPIKELRFIASHQTVWAKESLLEQDLSTGNLAAISSASTQT